MGCMIHGETNTLHLNRDTAGTYSLSIAIVLAVIPVWIPIGWSDGAANLVVVQSDQLFIITERGRERLKS